MKDQPAYRIFVLIADLVDDNGVILKGHWEEVEGELNLGSIHKPKNPNVKKVKMFPFDAS